MNEIVRKASDAQAFASDPEASAFVSANAGTGKTKLLTDGVLRLLLEGAVADGILCVTYTRVRRRPKCGTELPAGSHNGSLSRQLIFAAILLAWDCPLRRRR